MSRGCCSQCPQPRPAWRLSSLSAELSANAFSRECTLGCLFILPLPDAPRRSSFICPACFNLLLASLWSWCGAGGAAVGESCCCGAEGRDGASRGRREPGSGVCRARGQHPSGCSCPACLREQLEEVPQCLAAVESLWGEAAVGTLLHGPGCCRAGAVTTLSTSPALLPEYHTGLWSQRGLEGACRDRAIEWVRLEGT